MKTFDAPLTGGKASAPSVPPEVAPRVAEGRTHPEGGNARLSRVLDVIEDLPYDVVDVFTDRPFSGNALAVVHDADELDTEQMQAIAREFQLSETTFPLDPTDEEEAAGAAYRLRIFTPAVELPFAGHPSIGTAWLLARQGRVAPGTVVQACGAGLLPLTVPPDGGPVELTGGTPYAGPGVDPDRQLSAVGLRRPDLDEDIVRQAPPRIVGTGLPYSILPVRADALRTCAPDLHRLRDLDRAIGTNGVYVVAIDLEAQSVRARMFAGDIGIAEDPATGSAALALGVWLAASGLLPGDGEHSFTIEQGIDMGRASLLRLRVDVEQGAATRCHVAGDTVHVASGTIRVPAAPP
jgi:trans-2,3-dihydro-3-hydroxyanthranilate isomerase